MSIPLRQPLRGCRIYTTDPAAAIRQFRGLIAEEVGVKKVAVCGPFADPGGGEEVNKKGG